MTLEPGFDCFCIVELFGHSRIAGRVSEQVIGGQGFVRVDVPACNGIPEFTRLFGPGAIYSITPVSEEIANQAAAAMQVRPVNVYLGLAALRPSLLPGASEEDDDDELTAAKEDYAEEKEDGEQIPF